MSKLVAQARADVGRVRELMARIESDFYEMGVVLKRLKDSGAAAALGYRTFDEMCKVEMELSGATAANLIRIVENIGSKVARGLGQSQALSLLRLCEATPEDDTVDDLLGKHVELPSGDVLDVDGSSVREKDEAAKAIRDAHKTGDKATGKRGRTTTAEERRVAAQAEAELHAVGLTDATVRAIATRPGKPSALRIEGIPVPKLALLCRALCAKRPR